MNGSNFTSTKKLCYALIVFMLFLNSGSIFGQKNIYKANRAPLTHTEIMNPSLEKKFVDPQMNVPNHISFSPKAFVRLRVNSEAGPFVWTKTILNLTIIPILPGGTEDTPYQQRLEVEYNPLGNSANFIDLSSHEMVHRYGVKVKVDDYKTVDVNSGSESQYVNQNVTLELGFESERYYQLTEQLPLVSAVIEQDNDGTPVALNFNWQNLVGALEYELEWTWVDNYGTTSATALQPNQISFSLRNFELNNTRVRTSNPYYQIPLIYSKGYIIYRVRGVGRFMDDVSKTYYGPWSTGITNNTLVSDWENNYIQINEHESGKNWQFQASYAEQGKKKEVVSYFDGSLRNRQTVTKVNSDKNAVVGEVIYDAQGRPAVEILPAPVNNGYIRYFRDLNRNQSEIPYTHLDFDWEEPQASSCYTQISGMLNKSGSSEYYSKNNPIESPFRDFIPAAFDYPFSQIEYTPDNTGRVSRKGSVGQSHQLGTDHEMKYFYSVPNQEELNRLFGYHVGFVSHYKKNIAVDPNGQASVSYLDPQGRTIATALAGGSPKYLEGLEDERDTKIHGKITTDLLNKLRPNDQNTSLDNNELGSTFNFSNHQDVLTLSKQIGVAGNNIEHNFKYTVSNREYFKPELCDENYSFVYKLNISLRDACAVNLLKPIVEVPIGTRSIGTTPTTFDTNQPILPEDLSLNTGAYSLLKELRVDEVILNEYANNYIKRLTDPKSTCYVDPRGFSPSITINCETTCEECTTSIGTQPNYVLTQLNGVYNVPSGTTMFTVNPTTYVVTIISQPAPGSPINFGQPISNDEANGLANRFKDEWVMLRAACDQLCGLTFSSSCAVYQNSLLKDVSPYGQYGLIKNDLDNTLESWDLLSLYNDNNKIIYGGSVNNNSTIRNNWRNPATPYLNEEGQLSYVELEVTGTNTYSPAINPGTVYIPTPDDGRRYVLPQNLANVKDFLGNWEETWAESLLKYHPEFCYLEYSNNLCKITKSVNVQQYTGPNNDIPITPSQNKNLTSDEYDSYLDYIDTYQKAVTAGYFNLSNPTNITIFTNDPYYTQLNGFETLALFDIRKTIMLEALNVQYEENTLNSDGSGGAAKLFQVAVQMVKCNTVQTCQYSAINFSTLTTLEKDRIWNTYKNLYKSLKEKVKYVFINIYATSKGCYNGCIGESGSSTITSVVTNYNHYGQLTAINNYLQANNPTNTAIPAFCTIPEASNYAVKQKRFIPIDFAYDSDIDPNDAIDQLLSDSNYQYYAQTGNCPLVNDLNLYLEGFFKDINLAVPIATVSGSQPFSQSLSAKLFGEFTGQTTLPLPVSPAPTISTAISGSNLIFTFNPSVIPATAAKPLTLTLPSSSGLNWANYAMLGVGKWHIIGFSQMFYDVTTSSLTGANPVFGFKVVAKIQVNISSGAPNIIEVVLTGRTLARIGECQVEGQGDTTVGEILVPDSSTCNVKGKFAKALKDLLVNLQTLGQVTNTYNITNNSVFTSGFLHDYFGVQPGDVVQWVNTPNTTSGSSIVINGVTRFTTFHNGPNLNNQDLVTNITIGNMSSAGHAHQIYISINHQGTVTQYNGGITAGARYALYLVCCSPCGEWDLNGNGIGDLCDEGPHVNLTACSVAAVQEQTYENNLRDFLNNFLLPGNHQISNGNMYTPGTAWLSTSSNQYLVNFVNQSNLLALFQSHRNSLHNLDVNYNVPVSLDRYMISSGGNLTHLTFRSETNVPINYSWVSIWKKFNEVSYINYIDIINNNQAELSYKDLQGATHVEIVSIANMTNYTATENTSSGLGAPFCNFINMTTYVYPVPQAARNVAKADVMATKEGLITMAESQELGRPIFGDPISGDPIDFPGLKDEKPICPCIPQTVAPVDCEEEYEQYIKYFKFVNGVSTVIKYLNQSSLYSQADFCASNAQYLVDSYLAYLSALNVISTEDPNYLTIIQFGHTGLNYGYNNINEVIQLYAAYNPAPEENPALLLWNEYVNTIYMVEKMTDCPPAPMQTFSIPVTLLNPCVEFVANVSATYQLNSYNDYIAYLRREFIRQYIEKAMSTVVENFTMRYDDKEYQYTLYYYDQAGNLIQTIAPEGVKRFNGEQLAGLSPEINSYRDHNPQGETPELIPQHNFKTEYKYNTLNQLVWQQTPDGGITRFAYDALGRIIASQNAKQLYRGKEKAQTIFSYTKYDYLGRVIEVGEIYTKPSYSINDDGRLIFGGGPVNEFFADIVAKMEVTKSVYDEDPLVETSPELFASSLFSTNDGLSVNPAHNNRNRITGIFYYDYYFVEGREMPYDNAIFYNYDVHGNVKEVVNYNTYLRNLRCSPLDLVILESGAPNDCEKHLKRIVYEYDLISGNVNKVTLQPNKIDQFIHKYSYDADNRIVGVETSSDGVLWEKDANYKYYPHGPLARVELGDKKIQGIDYAYTLQGWLKVVNGENIDSFKNDMGYDGNQEQGTKTKDAFGFSLSYYDKEYRDYVAINNDNGEADYRPLMFSRNNSIGGTDSQLYNGNIKQMTTGLRVNNDELLPVQKNNYNYDQLNRIVGMNSISIRPEDSGYRDYSESYRSNYSYDRNGNILNLYRTAPTESGNIEAMDKLEYDYLPGNNKLTVVKDYASNTFTNDLKNQVEQLAALGYNYDINDLNSHNYIYDEIGQLVQDRSEGLKIEWRVDGKVKMIDKEKERESKEIYFQYDGLGNRIAKKVIDRRLSDSNARTTYYVRDAQGNVLGVYDLLENSGRQGETKNLYLKEHHLFGSSRLGLEEKNLHVYKYVPGRRLREGNDISSKDGNITMSTPEFIPVNRDYSLNFNTTNTATWPMKLTAATVDPELKKISLDTRFKLLNTGIASAEYGVGQLQYKGTKTILDNTAVIPNLSAYPCFGVFLNVGSSAIDVTKSQASNCTASVIATVPAFAANQNGTLEYDLSNVILENNGVSVGFTINNTQYLFKTGYVGSGLLRVYTAVNNTITGDHGFISPGSTLKIQRNGNALVFIVNQNPVFTANTPGTMPANFTLVFGSTANSIKNLKIFKVENSVKEITNQVQLSLVKNTNGYTPKINVTQYRKDQATSIIDKYSYNVTSSTVVTPAQIQDGITLNFNAEIGATSNNFMIVNGTNQSLSTPLWINLGTVSTVPTVSDNGDNRLGGAFNGLPALGFSMCYFNYALNNGLANSVSHSFSFDDVTSTTITNNPPKPAQNSSIQMTVTPSVVRTLGPCLPDTDQDGIYDIYEDVNNDGNLADDTDGDGIYNYLDPDDDGDGVLTIYEGADPDGNHNPATGIASLNTNATNVNNPNIQVNTIPNYLDPDDDGDGYATWEEGSNLDGDLNPNTGPTRDTDGDGIPDYLDYNDRIYPEIERIALQNFLNLVGDKRYELSNHLGNVLIVISDKKIPNSLDGFRHFNADVLNYNDYYPFGMLVPNRHGSSDKYRYGFQGQEKDDEIKGEGNSMNYTFRMHDSRVGRFFAPDPLESKYPNYSPYQFSGNKVIHAIELEGLEEFEINKIDGTKGIAYGPHTDAASAQSAYNATIKRSSIVPRDEYEKAILSGRISFTKNYGWVDNTHAFTDSKRKTENIGVQSLWNQIINEPSKDKLHMGHYGVAYKQDVVVGGFSIGVERLYAVKAGLSLEEKKSVALTIFQDVSYAFENLQSVHPTSSSSFEPADLPSNMLNFYRVVQSGMNTTKIKNLIKPLDEISSLIIYRSYPGTFTDKKFKNHKFTPLFFKTNFSLNGFSIPKELNAIKPAKKENLFLVDQDIFKTAN